MKCPKCGSKITKFRGYLTCSNELCSNHYGFTNEEMHELLHQARLERVLSKLNAYKGIENHKFYYVGDSKISIEFNNGKFYLEDRDERQVQISLDTVESLLKDLGELDV